MTNFVKEELYFTRDYIINKVINPITTIDSNSRLKDILITIFTGSMKKFVDEIITIATMIEEKKLDEKVGQEKFNVLCNEIVVKSNRVIVQEVKDKLILKEIKKAFRLLLKKIIYDNSILMKRALEKPRGYPGDYLAIESDYNNTALSSGIGKYFDRYYLTNNYAVAVRNRKDKMRDIILDFINKSTKEHLNIVDLGSGSAREIRELVPKLRTTDTMLDFTCIDFDEESLMFSKKELSTVIPKINFHYIKKNLVTLFDDIEYMNTYRNTADMVYTIGFADYFLNTILEKLIRFSFNNLSDNGTMVIAHKDIDADPVTPIYFDWFCDWKFVPRNEEQLIEIVKNSGIKNYSISVDREKSGIIFFVKVIKERK